ncbi:MAG: hypothetical protein AAF750_18795 [Planctomycetota bacterium]
MPWFQSLCRNLGLAVHHVKNADTQDTCKQTVRHDVEEKQLNPTTTLRRTTIEEIEIRSLPPEPMPGDKPGSNGP